MRKTTQAESGRTEQEARGKKAEPEIRPGWLLSIDFEGEDRSLTQAELAILK